MHTRRALGAGLLAAAALPGTVRAAETLLRTGIAQAPLAADPHFYNGYPDKALALHVFSRLLEQTGDTSLRPGLAETWHAVTPTEWLFTLRPGVLFSDGSPLTGDDVVFSYARAPEVPNTPGGFGPVLRKVAAVEVLDPAHLRIRTTVPHPNLPNDLANVAILSRRAAEGASTADFNALKAAVGSGPYRLVGYGAGTGFELARNPHWWGERPD